MSGQRVYDTSGFSAESAYSAIYSLGKDVRSTWEQQLQPHGFLRPHKSWLVNFRHIHRIHRDTIVLSSGKSIPMSRRRTNEIREQYGILMREVNRLCRLDSFL